MSILFGTDGIRGFANKYPMDCETIVKIGRAIAEYFTRHDNSNKILIGCDTRISSPMITAAIVSGICSMGTNVVNAGVVTTPGVAILTAKRNFCAGIVISASHNKFYDNGIKLFDKNGCKLNDFVEAEIEKNILDPSIQNKSQTVKHTGKLFLDSALAKEYNDFLEHYYLHFSSLSLEKIKIIIDCANGATSMCAPKLFSKLGAEVTSLFCSPNGTNINDNCGSEHPEILSQVVLNKKADIGLAFDGDGDRLTVVSESGEILNGDQLLAIFAKDLKNRSVLKKNIVVSTVMSNLGLHRALNKMGIKHIKSEVGDKRVTEKMIETGAVLGGENSGHIIFLDQQSTGDAMLASLYLLSAIKRFTKPLSEISKIITLDPQCTLSVNINSKPDLTSVSKIQDAISITKKELGPNYRVLVRYSGTQPKCRIMVEGDEIAKVTKYCNYISNVISNSLN